MKKTLLLLCDYGLDDAAATVYLLNHRDAFENIYILPIGGNMPLSVAFPNAHRLLYHYEKEYSCVLDHVFIVETFGIKQPERELSDIHGHDGMGDILDNNYHQVVPSLNFETWLPTVQPENCIMASVGPCTVPAEIIRRVGSIPLIIMGGNIHEKPNYHGYEFNHGLDTAAFSYCIKFPHVAGTLDTCHHPLCDFYHINCEGFDLLSRLCKRSVELARQRGDALCAVYDLITVCYLFMPERFTVQKQTDKDGNLVNVLCYTSKEKILQLS